MKIKIVDKMDNEKIEVFSGTTFIGEITRKSGKLRARFTIDVEFEDERHLKRWARYHLKESDTLHFEKVIDK